MTVNEVMDRIGEPMVAWHMQICLSRFTKQLCQDEELLKEGMSECFRAVYDTLREFEAECIKRGIDQCAKWNMVRHGSSDCGIGDFTPAGVVK